MKLYCICGDYNFTPGLKQICNSLKNGNPEDIDYVAHILYDRFPLLDCEIPLVLKSKYGINESIMRSYFNLSNYRKSFFCINPLNSFSNLIGDFIDKKDILLFTNIFSDGEDVIPIIDIYKDYYSSISIVAITVDFNKVHDFKYYNNVDIICV